MKILYVSSNGGIHDYRFLKKLAADHEVLFLHYAAFEIVDEIDAIEHLQIISKKPAFRSMPLISERGHFKKILKDFKPDIIHSGYVWQVGILAANSGFHPHLSMPWGSDVLLDPDKSYTIRKLVKRVMRSSDHVQCDAEFVKHKIINDYSLPGDKITVFPWGIDLDQFKKTDKSTARKYLNLDENKFIFLFTRHFAVVYGVDNLLEAFRVFSEGKNDVMMLMLSEGPRKVEALKFITYHGLDEKIQVIGKVPNKELPAFLNASDVFVSPSISDGTSLSLLEAMACGLGLIVTDVPAIKEWVTDDNGLTVKIDNIKELIGAMEKYYNSRNLINEHGSNSIKISRERANWDKNYLKLNEIYDHMLKNVTIKNK